MVCLSYLTSSDSYGGAIFSTIVVWYSFIRKFYHFQKIFVCVKLLMGLQKMMLLIFLQVLLVFCKELFNMILMVQLGVKKFVVLWKMNY